LRRPQSSDRFARSQNTHRYGRLTPSAKCANAAERLRPWASINPPSVNERFTSIIPDLYAHGQWSGEIAFPQDNAPDRYFDLSIWVQDDGCFLSIARETTARKAAEKHNALLREQLQIAQSRQQFAQLAGGLAHDINNYIAVIMHGVDALKSEASPNVIDSIERMETATRQVLSLAQNMCKLGSRATERIRTEIRPIVRQATDLLRPSLGGDATLSLNLPDEALYIQCDPTEIMQALLNLLINARDALPDDPSADRRIEVKISEFHLSENIIDADVGTTCRQKRYTRIEIRDTGMGLDDYVKARIFDPYFTTKGERGTGLGMSIVSRILVANHAALRICSEPGEGTSMQVYWPIASDTEQGLQPAVLSADQRNELLDGMTILLVDPDDTCLDEVADLLTAAGAEVVSCLNAEDAIESLSEDPFLCDVVVFNAKKGMAEAKELKETVLHSASGVQMVLTIDEKKSHFAIDEVQNENMSILQQPLSESLLVEALHRAKLRIKNKG
jgi:signal transduction histidine kinase